MPKRLYVSPTQYWHLPDATNLRMLKEELEEAVVTGRNLTLVISLEGVPAELNLLGGRLGQFALVETGTPGHNPVEVYG